MGRNSVGELDEFGSPELGEVGVERRLCSLHAVADVGYARKNCGGVLGQQAGQECIRANGFDAVRCLRFGRKVRQIERDNLGALPVDGGGQDVTVVRIGQG
jgi:hypothetical protein